MLGMRQKPGAGPRRLSGLRLPGLLLAPIVNAGTTPVPGNGVPYDGATFVHEGRSCPWVYTVTRVNGPDGSFSAAADISKDAQRGCKLVLCLPNGSKVDGFDRLRQKCLGWIEQPESMADVGSDGSPRVVASCGAVPVPVPDARIRRVVLGAALAGGHSWAAPPQADNTLGACAEGTAAIGHWRSAG